MKKYFLTALLCLSFLTFIQADTHYVSHSGSSTPPYLSWETAADSIQKCLDISNDGDTVYVANGIYKENISIHKKIFLSGLSMDSTIIDGRERDTVSIGVFSSSKVSNLHFFGRTMWWVMWAEAYVEMNNCRISEGWGGVAILHSSSMVNNLIMKNIFKGYDAGCYSGGCTNYLTNSVIIIDQELGKGIHADLGGDYIFSNNIILFTREHLASQYGIFAGWPNRITINNNLISGFGSGIVFDFLDDSAFVTNNLITHCGEGINTQLHRVYTRNTVLANNTFGFIGNYFQENYNLFWKNIEDFHGLSGSYTYNDSDIAARDPMFIKDTLANPLLDFDYHLQAFSPAIDKGDPSILDKDNTRSDIGMFGGPGGVAYSYKDLAPHYPLNFTATVNQDSIKLKWNKNSESDTSCYRVYRDTIQNFTLDPEKIIASPGNNLFTERIPNNSKHLYYKITAVDKNNNESLPSEEIYIDLTSAGDETPQVISSYQLYQNYPNPFNPTTIIPYRLKERGYVKLMVYDIKGEQIRVLVNKVQEAGYYEQEFNGIGLSSGIYLYRIEVIGKGSIPVFSDMKKQVLLK